MTLPELYAALEEADKRAQAGDAQAQTDAAELASMIEQYKESSAPATSEADYVNPIYIAAGTGILGGAKGFSNAIPTAQNIASAMSPSTPSAPSNAPLKFNPRGVSVDQSVENWRNYADAQNEAAKGVRRDTSLAKKYPNFQRKPLPMGPEADDARNAARQKINKGVEFSGRMLNKTPGVNVAGGAMAGYQGADAYNRFQEGDVAGGTVSAIGSAGSGAATLMGKGSPKVRALGLATGAIAPLINRGIDKLRGEPEEKAMGGPVGYAKGKKVIEGGLEAAKKLFDPRFDKRVLEQEKLANQVLKTEKTGAQNIPKIYLPDYEGYGMVTSMSDRTAGGSRLLGVNDVNFNRPVELTGGQEYMYNNPGQVWASGKNPVNQIMKEAVAMKKATGKDPLYMPWRMAPTASDFAHMTGETMLTHAQSAMGKAQKKDLDNTIKKFIPDWSGIDDPESMQQFMTASAKARKSIQNALDRDLRGSGGMSIGETRLAIADPNQLTAPEGGLMHVGRISADKPVIEASGNVTYPKGVPGEGMGQLDRDHFVTEFLPDFAKERRIADPRSPGQTDIRALQMKPYSGIIDDKLLKSLGYAAGGNVVKKGLGFLKPSAKSHSQDPKVARALEEYLKGNISQEERIAIMNKQLPLRPWTEMPPSYSDEQIKMALMENKKPKALAEVPAGARVGNRLDIPAYTQHGVYVDTTHDLAKGNSPISYNRTGHLKDVEFSSKPNQAVRVGLGTKEQALTPMGAEMGSAKSPFALIKGTNVGTSDEEVRRMMAEMMKDPSYAQIGMDPRRHSQFYDKSTGMPVWAAEEKLQSGPLILAPRRGLEITDWNDPRLSLSDFEGKKYAKGGSTTPAWQRAEGKNPEGGLNAAGRASYNRETGGNLKAPQPEGGPRKKSFCARMEGMKKKNTSSKTANDPDSRINKSLRKWKC
jgi:hypothetical protein